MAEIVEQAKLRERKKVLMHNRLEDFNVPTTGVGLHTRNLYLYLWAKVRSLRLQSRSAYYSAAQTIYVSI